MPSHQLPRCVQPTPSFRHLVPPAPRMELIDACRLSRHFDCHVAPRHRLSRSNNVRAVDLTQPFTTPDIETGYQVVDAVVKAVGEPACTDVPSVCNAVARVVTHAGERQGDESKKLHARRGTVGKTAAAGMKDRGSGMVAAEVADTADKHTLQGFVAVDTEVDAVVRTYEHGSYEGVPRPHQAVEHSVEEHVDGQDRTNGIESFRANLKRGCNSAYHQMSAKHLHRHASVAAGPRLRRRPGIARRLADVEHLRLGVRKYHLGSGGVAEW